MILTYERFLNPFRDKLITQDDFELVSDLFLEISDDLKEVEYADRYMHSTSDYIKDRLVSFHGMGRIVQFCMFRTFIPGKLINGHMPYRQIVIGIRLFEADVPFPIKKEKLRDRLIRFKKRLTKYKFESKIVGSDSSDFTFLIIINK